MATNEADDRSGASFAELIAPSFFKALCDPTRAAILGFVAQCGEAATVSQIARCCPIDLSVVSRHLATLRDAGILRAEKRGKEVYYSLQVQDVTSTLRGLADALERCCEPRPKEDPDAPDHP